MRKALKNNTLNLSEASDDDLLEIEQAIPGAKYGAIGIGAVLNDFLIINRGASVENKKKRKTLFRLISALVREWFFQATQKNIAGFKGKIAFTNISDRQHVRDLARPTMRVLGPDRCALVAHCSSDGAKGLDFPTTTFRTIYRTGPRMPILAVLNFVVSCRSALKTSRFARAMSKTDKSITLCKLAIGLLRFHSATQWLNKTQPLAIVVEFDRNETTVPLVLAAKNCGIQVITFQHGLMNFSYGFLPLLADNILVWGERSREFLLERQVPPRKIRVAGCPAVRSLSSEACDPQPEERRADRGRGVLLATGPWPLAQKIETLDAFLTLARLEQDLTLTIRTHPAEDSDFYRSQVERGLVEVVSGAEISAHESLLCADIVICANSGFGLEAMRYGKPVIILTLGRDTLKGSSDWLDNGAAVCATSKTELGEEIQALIGNQQYFMQRRTAGLSYIEKVYQSVGDVAATQSAKLIESILDES